MFNRLRFSGILLATREEGIVTPLHIGMIGTINAEQLSATSNKTHDALVRRHAMGKNPGGSAYGYEKRIESPALGIVPLELWDRVKFRQATLARTAKPRTEMAGLPFFAEQRPRYLLTGKITCGSCGASYAKSGKTRFGCQGAAKKGPTWCGNRLTIRQDELDARVLAGLATEMLRDDVVAAFLLEYEAETRRLTAETVSAGPEREAELANLDHKLSRAKAAILKGVDAMVFVDEMKIWTERRKALLAELNLAEQETTDTVSPEPGLLTPDLGRVYREKVEQLTAAFEDEALKAQASERLRALIEAVLTPEDGDLAIDLRGELVSMVSLCAGAETQKASAGIPSEAL